jgi:hypothetical protein
MITEKPKKRRYADEIKRHGSEWFCAENRANKCLITKFRCQECYEHTIDDFSNVVDVVRLK